MKPRELAALRQKGSKGYKAPVRKRVTITTASLAAGAQTLTRISLAVSYKLIAIQVSGDSRVRLYDSGSSQVSDQARAIGTDPADGSGVVFEFVAVPGLYAATLSPLVSGSSMEFPPSKDIAITVTNTGTGAAAITVTLTWIEEE